MFLSFFVLSIWSLDIKASSNVSARIGDKYFDTLAEAIEASTSTDTINLTSNVVLEEPLEIHKTVHINLNNYNIEAENQVFLIRGGGLKLSGTGKIIETKPYYGAIVIKGSDEASKEDFSTLSIGSDVTLEGWSGIFVDHYNKVGYGILINMNGDINAVDDTNGDPGAGIYVNGYIQHQDNAPTINLSDTVKITSTGNGIYSAGYATYNINGAYIEGAESGLGIKAGVFNIIDGTIVGSGADKTPTEGNNNGINASGTAIQIESNPSYSGGIELNIKNGIIRSENSNVIYEYTVNNSSTKVKSVSLTGGTYTSKAGKDVFLLSDSFENTHSDFVTGGTYSSNPLKYLKSGYSSTKNKDNLYEVTADTMSVFGFSENNDTSFIPVFTIVSLIILGIIAYINRTKILNFVDKIRYR